MRPSRWSSREQQCIVLGDLGLFACLGEEVAAAVFDEVGNELEAFLATVVGIWDEVVRELGAIVGKHLDFVFVFVLGKGLDAVKVIVIHGEDEIEVIEILCGDLAGRALWLIAARCESGTHTRVWCIASMVADGACGIDVIEVFEFIVFDHLAEDDFCRRRSADIAHADE